MRTWWGGYRSDPAPDQQGSLTAAAVTVDIGRPPSQVLWGGAAWQQEAWLHYDTCPELHAAAAIIGSAFSRAKMIVVDVDPVTMEMGTEPTDNVLATALVGQLFGGPTGKSQAQRQIGIHLTVPGECWVLASDARPDVDAQTWRIISVAEVWKAGSTIRIEQLDGTQRNLQPTELLFRLFQPHPKRSWEADSPTRALLPVFRELAGLSAQVTASIKSRLATGGVWLLPQSATLPPPKDQFGEDLPGTVDQADQWLQLLTNAMVAAIGNPDSASAVAPIIAMVPDDVLDKIKDPIQFVQDILSEARDMRADAQKRVAVGMDMPAEILTGVGDINHWGQWFISEDFIRGPITSLLQLPADALTTHYLRPGLRLGGEDPRLFAIRFDIEGMIADANEQNAIAAYGSGVLSEEAFLTALHFDPIRDAATPDERIQRLILNALERGNPDTLAELGPSIVKYFPGLQLAPLPVAPSAPAAIGAAPAPKAIEAPSTTATRQPPATPAAGPSNTPPPSGP